MQRVSVLNKKRNLGSKVLDDKRIWRVPGKGMPFTALLSQAYVYILYVCKVLVSFSGEQFSCFVDLVSICLLICCCSWLLSVWVCNMLISVLIKSYFGCNVLSAFHRSYML